jgi:hypothetical protein
MDWSARERLYRSWGTGRVSIPIDSRRPDMVFLRGAVLACFVPSLVLMPFCGRLRGEPGKGSQSSRQFDINGDGVVDYADAAMVHANPGGPAAYDVNRDGRIDSRDVELIMRNATPRRSRLGYQPIRKVHAHIRTWNGNWQRDPLGLVSWWSLKVPHEQAVATLQRRIERLAEGAGVRHFVLQLPGGSVAPRMCASQFWPIPEQRRTLLRSMARGLKERYPDLQLGVYCGWELDPTPETTEMEGWRHPDWHQKRDRAAMLHQYAGWRELDFDFLTFDAIAAQSWRDGSPITWMRYIERETGLRAIGEAYPLKMRGRLRVNDDQAMNEHAWMALQRYIDRRKIAGDDQAARYMGLNGHAPGWNDSQAERLRMVSECVDGGFIPWIYETGSDEENLAVFRHAVERLAQREAALRTSARLPRGERAVEGRFSPNTRPGKIP